MPGWLKALLIATVVVVLLIVAVIGVLVGAGFYGWKAAVRAGNEAAALQNMKTIAAVEIQYFNNHKRTFGTADQLVKEALLNIRFSGDPPHVDGYVFTLTVTPGTKSQPASYLLNADPETETSGKNHFCLDSTDATIHVNSTRPASATDPPFGR